ncbi:hypothetical protein B0H66DRAFT_126821 [Apodospora peruviana]|uniref:DSC E3 ubiquitin ligase complex subunit A n=1 Tax=Apodospora peruviana TaxID=516989 RepID=A0AAE0MAZ9_9PEZI|nr:hypothetical protein B0H66DRAFT_126821 [Apodospora peruviana]
MPQSSSLDGARVVLSLLVLFWLFNSPDNGPGLISAPLAATSRLARQSQAHSLLNSTKWGDFLAEDDDDGAGVAAPRYLNMTGFREHDRYAWEDLARFRNRCREWSRNAYPPDAREGEWEHGLSDQSIWQNATGSVFGEWARRPGKPLKYAADYNLSAITPGISWLGAHAEWDRNITGAHGTILLRLDEDANSIEYEEKAQGRKPLSSDRVRQTSGLATFQDVASGSGSWDVRVHGVHWPRQGAILLSTTSEKFAGIFGLPHLAPSREFFESSRKLLNRTLDKVLQKKERSRFTDPTDPWTSDAGGAEDPWSLTPRCEYVLYLQLHPLDAGLAGSRKGAITDAVDIEKELRQPTGAPIGKVPDLRMSLVAWSPDCSYYLESKGPPHYPSVDGQHLVGMKEEINIYRANTWELAFAAIMMGQIWLLKAQMKETNTPSTIGRVSFYTASIMVLADGLIFGVASAWSLGAETSFLPSLFVTFAGFMSMVLGGAFLADVYRTQEPERRNRERTSNTPRVVPSPVPAGDALPRPVTAGPPRAPSPPIIIPSDQDVDAEIAENTAGGAAAVPSALPRITSTTTATAGGGERPARALTFSAITGWFVFIGTFLLFISAAASTWPVEIRAFYINAMCFCYLSLWVPQIWRNVQRNSRRAFAWRFMIGQSVLRLLPLAYFYLSETNFLFARTDWQAFAVLAGWVWVQLWVLGFQDILGPRFGIPASWTPEAWDYHPVLREDNIEAGLLPIGLMGGGGGGGGSSVSDYSPTMERVRSWSLGGRSESGDAGAAAGARERKKDKDRERRGIHIRCIDCAICKEILQVPVVRAGAEDPAAAVGGVTGVLARRAYMVTPCRHIFHTKCLEGWLRLRLQCPICREELPPL